VSNNDLWCNKCKSQHHPADCPMDMSGDLKPCPFCGTFNKIMPPNNLIVCECSYSTRSIDEWNNAYCWNELKAKQSRIDRLEGALKRIIKIKEKKI